MTVTFWTEPADLLDRLARDARRRAPPPPRLKRALGAAARDRRGGRPVERGRRSPAATALPAFSPLGRSRICFRPRCAAAPQPCAALPARRARARRRALRLRRGGGEPRSSRASRSRSASLEYNIQITRFLNPDDNEDAEYLVGLPQPEPGTGYLGVFLVIENETDTPRPSAHQLRGQRHARQRVRGARQREPLRARGRRRGTRRRPAAAPDTTAATGPNQGALLIFQVDDAVSENRPLELEIETYDGTGEVILDI